MKLIRIVLWCSSIILLFLVFAALHFFAETKPFVHDYADHASGLGLLVSVVGFGWTLWTVVETLRANAEFQDKLQKQVAAARWETEALLSRIRLQSMSGVREQASYHANEALHAIQAASWLQAAGACKSSRQFGLRVLSYDVLEDTEKTALRNGVEDLDAIRKIAEKLQAGPSKGITQSQVSLIHKYMDALTRIESRLHQKIMENPDVDGRTT